MTKKKLIEVLEPYDDDMEIKLYESRYDQYDDVKCIESVTNPAYADNEGFIAII